MSTPRLRLLPWAPGLALTLSVAGCFFTPPQKPDTKTPTSQSCSCACEKGSHPQPTSCSNDPLDEPPTPAALQ